MSEAGGHGMQVFDLTELRNVTNPPIQFTATAHYGQFGNAHNIFINEEQPWVKIKIDKDYASNTLGILCHYIICLSIMCSPIMPDCTNKIQSMLNISENNFNFEVNNNSRRRE